MKDKALFHSLVQPRERMILKRTLNDYIVLPDGKDDSQRPDIC